MASGDLPSRDEALGGFPAKRAATLLYLIENRSAQLADRRRRELQRFRSEDLERDRDLAFFQAFAEESRPPVEARIQQIDRYAPQWASIVPGSARGRAALAHAISEKYRFTRDDVAGLREVLHLEEPAVRSAFERMYGAPLDSIYAPRRSLGGALRWYGERLSRRLESLPPFWSAFALTLTETVGVGILALPIALAEVGPVAGIIFLAIFGLVNVLTIAAIAEAITRTASVRYGNAYFGRLVEEYLGRTGAVMMTGTLGAICFLVLICYYIGFSTALSGAIGFRKELWAVVLFGIGLYYTSRGSLHSTVGSALIVGGINMVLISLLIGVTVPHISRTFLGYVNVPFIGGRQFDPTILGLLFGVVLSAYFGHLSIGTCGKYVLRRDPTGRSLLWGAATAQLMAMTIYCIWIFAINGAISAHELAAQSGTVLQPLTKIAGPAVQVVGSIFVILGMGMGSIHFSLALFNMMQERLPRAAQVPLLQLTRGRGRLLVRPRGAGQGDPLVTISYHGLRDGQARFRVDLTANQVSRRWSLEASDSMRLSDPAIPELTIGVVEAQEDEVRVRVDTPWTIGYEADWRTAGLRALDLLELQDEERQVVERLMRGGDASADAIAGALGVDQAAVEARLYALEGRGAVERVGVERPIYRARFGSASRKQLPQKIWDALGAGEGRPQKPAAPPRSTFLRSKFGRYVISNVPLFAVFLTIEYLMLTNSESFAGALSFVGVIAIPVFAGLFPALLLMSSRVKGEIIPGFVLRMVGPTVATAIYLIFLTSIVIHGLVVWTNPILRALALLSAVVTTVMTIQILRRGALARRLSVSLRHDREKREAPRLEIVRAGKLFEGDLHIVEDGKDRSMRAASAVIPRLETLQRMSVEVDTGGVTEVKAWAQRIEEDGTAKALPGTLEVQCGASPGARLPAGDGSWKVPVAGERCIITIAMGEGAE